MTRFVGSTPVKIAQVALIAVMAAYAGSGCGGGADGSGEKTRDGAAKGASESAGKPESGSTGTKKKASRKETRRRARERKAEARAERVRVAARSAVRRLRLGKAQVSVSKGGRSVTILLRARNACTAVPGVEAEIIRRIRRTAPFAKDVRVKVAHTGQTLERYVSSSCGDTGLRGGKGRVVFEQSGNGYATTKSFGVSGKRWTVEFQNTGPFFQAYVFKGNEPQRGVLRKRRPGTGSRSFEGPGRFKLRIASAGGWRIRVRDTD